MTGGLARSASVGFQARITLATCVRINHKRRRSGGFQYAPLFLRLHAYAQIGSVLRVWFPDLERHYEGSISAIEGERVTIYYPGDDSHFILES